MSSDIEKFITIVDDAHLNYSSPISQGPNSTLMDDINIAQDSAWGLTLSVITAPNSFVLNFTGYSRVGVFGSVLRANNNGNAQAKYTVDGNLIEVSDVPWAPAVVTDFPLFFSGELDAGAQHSLEVDITSAGAGTPYVLDYIMVYTPSVIATGTSGTSTNSTSTMDGGPTQTSSARPDSGVGDFVASIKPFVWPVVGALAALNVALLFCLILTICKLNRARAAAKSAKLNAEAAVSPQAGPTSPPRRFSTRGMSLRKAPLPSPPIAATTSRPMSPMQQHPYAGSTPTPAMAPVPGSYFPPQVAGVHLMHAASFSQSSLSATAAPRQASHVLAASEASSTMVYPSQAPAAPFLPPPRPQTPLGIIGSATVATTSVSGSDAGGVAASASGLGALEYPPEKQEVRLEPPAGPGQRGMYVSNPGPSAHEGPAPRDHGDSPPAYGV